MIKAGDYFCVQTKSPVSGPILALEKLRALDHEAIYNHAGIIVSPDGTTFESLKKIAHYGLQGYEGCPIIIARHKFMTEVAFARGYAEVRKWDGNIYPFWRLALHAIGLARFLHATNIPVCSELVVEHLHHAGIWSQDGYGWTPDALADKFRDNKCYDVVFEGRLEWKTLSQG